MNDNDQAKEQPSMTGRGRAGDRGPSTDRDGLEALLAEHLSPGQGPSRLTRIADQMDALARSPQGARALHHADALRAEARRRKARWPARLAGAWRPLAAAAAIAVMIGGVALRSGVFDLFDGGVERHVTALGEQRSVTLADGSVVRLNTLTRIGVAFSDGQRRIDLVEGQASFDVAHDAARPFVVAAGDGLVTALGTEFDVLKAGPAVVVTLVSGSVTVEQVAAEARASTAGPAVPSPDEVSEPRQTVVAAARLDPGEQVSIVPDGALTPVAAVDLDQVTAWQRGKIKLVDTPLAEAIAEVNRYSTTRLDLADDTLAQERIGGVFDVGDTDTFVRALEVRFGLRAVRASTRRVVLMRPASG